MRGARKGVMFAVCIAVLCAILVSCSKQTKIADSTQGYLADMPLMASEEPTKIADCTRENVTSVGLLDGKIPVVCYYKEKARSETKRYYVDIGGETGGGAYDQADSPIFSPDGKSVAYRAEIDGKNYVIAGEEKAGPYDGAMGLTYSPDGKTLAYWAEIDDEYTPYLLIDGTPCLGSICGGHAVYLKDDAIWTR